MGSRDDISMKIELINHVVDCTESLFRALSEILGLNYDEKVENERNEKTDT